MAVVILLLGILQIAGGVFVGLTLHPLFPRLIGAVVSLRPDHLLARDHY